MKSNYHIFYESLIRACAATVIARNPVRFRSLLGEGKSSLLLEEFTNEEANNLSKALAAQKKITVDVAGALPEEMTNTKEVLMKLAAEIDQVSNTAEIATMAQKGDTKGLKKKIEELNTVFTRVGNLTAAVVQTMINAADNLQPVVNEILKNNLNKKPEDIEELKVTMAELSVDKAKKKEFGEIQKILKAVSDSFDVPDWQKSAIEKGSAAAQKDAGGLWGAVKGFIKSIFGKVTEKILVGGRDAFAKDLRQLSINEIIAAKSAMEKAKNAIVPATEASSGAVADATSGAAGSSGGQGGDVGQGGGSEQAATRVEQAVAAADKQALGKTVMDAIKAFAEPYKDNRAIVTTIRQLGAGVSDVLDTGSDLVSKDIQDRFTKWFDSLSDDQKQAFGDDADKKIKVVVDAIRKAVDDNLQMESRRRARDAALISEARGTHPSRSRSSLSRAKPSAVRLSEAQIVDRMRSAYRRRLHEVLGETDVRDTRGNVVIQPGLKVRHKKTQLEYTVDSVEEDSSGGVTIRLRNPEEPRFEPSYGQQFVGEEAPLLSARPDPEEPIGLEPLEEPGRPNLDSFDLDAPASHESGEEVEFVIDEKEFEKDYEVK